MELKDGPVAVGYAHEAQRLTTLLARFRPGQAHGGPFVAPERAYFAPDQHPPAHIDGEVDPYIYAWRGGTVRVWMPSEHAEVQLSKGKIRLMYFDREDFIGDMSSLTAAQMNLRLAARMKGPPAEELAAFISRLALEHAVFMRQATGVRTADPSARAEWAEAVALSIDNLLLAISRATNAPAPSLKTALARLRQDASLLGALAHASKTPSPSAPLVDGFVAAMNRL